MLFKFVKDAGEALSKTVGGLADGIMERIQGNETGVEGLKVEEQDGKIVLSGTAANRAEAEKAIIAAGNTPGVGEVESALEISADGPEAAFYTVQSGDTLSKIAKDHYGDAGKYPTIFEANKPMLSHPDKIYPGQTLRLPPID